MMKQKKEFRQASQPGFFKLFRERCQCGWGLWVLIAVLLFLSFVAGSNFDSNERMYVAGQIADRDITANRDLMVEDPQATGARKKQAIALVQPVYDHSMESYTQFQTRITDIFKALNNPEETPGPALGRLVEEIGPEAADDIVPVLDKPEIQGYILKTIMPMIRDQLAEGLLPDSRASRIGNSGILVRNLDTGVESYRPDVRSLPDTQSFLAEILGRMRQDSQLSLQARRAIYDLLSTTMPASLTLNREATQRRNADAEHNVQPVYYQILKGEILLRKGERVSREQQIKLQAFFDSATAPIRWHIVGGVFVISLFLGTGFFMTPSGRPGTAMRLKDALLISSLLLLFGVGAKAVCLFGISMNSISLQNSFAIAYPVPGAVGLVAMVFAARRYCVMGLLLSFLCAEMFGAGLPLFIYFFLGGMVATWLITRAQNRQDVVWSVVPLVCGLLFIWAGFALLERSPLYELPMLGIAAIINALLSLIILFALSPVLELAFSYSTRFRLMELMSLEQPLMQEIMVTIPGTYHHSLVVANMVEAGARAIGANSLLCKVAALYHDAGKLSYPEYFIENQFGAPNRHDQITPSMSALILLSHVKKGGELAAKYHLGQEIIDIITQHHGTRIMRYFYQKAINQGENPQENAYRYPGPRPQSKEAAILMLADSVEASSRTLVDPTPARIRSHIDNIIKTIFSEGQLDESELTFKDLHYLSESFQRILTGIFHQRIVYPEKNMKEERDETETARQTQKKSDAAEPGEPLQQPAS